MIVGILTIMLHIPMAHSLKEKRRQIGALKARLVSSFNVSVAEVGEQDKWQKGVLAVAHVGVTKPVVDSVLARVTSAVESFGGVQVIDHETELIG